MTVFADMRVTLEDGESVPVLGMIAFLRWVLRHPAAATALFDAVDGAYKAGSRDLTGFDAAMRNGHSEAYVDLVAAEGAGDGVSFLGMLQNVSLRLDEARKAVPAVVAGRVPVVHMRRRHRGPRRLARDQRRTPRRDRIRP